MVLPIDEIMKMLKDNVMKYRQPFLLPKWALVGWAEGIPRGGKVLLYTGGMYQYVPYIQAMVRYLEGLEGAKGGKLLVKFGRTVSKLFDVTKFVANVKEEEVGEAHQILRNIADVLKGSGIEFGYLYEEEPYPGTLLYDLGMEEAFKKHVKYVHNLLKGVRRVITVDPHTTYMFRHIYPKYVENFNIEVANYLEILAEKGYKARGKGRFTIHDPCLYARYEEIVGQPRAILNLELTEPETTGKDTACCGGPIEFLAPRLSGKMARDRIKQLKKASNEVITLCPICMGNLRRWGRGEVNIRDIALLL